MSTPDDFFKNDRYARLSGIELVEIRKGYSKARMIVEEKHLNAGNTTQGGAIFTLADLALAGASNSHGNLAFSMTSNITFLRRSGPGDILYAEARERLLHPATAHYQVDVTNQKGELIATFGATVYRKNIPLPFRIEE
ncbi:MAG: PaaI family thioesterase [Bacteroides sp.]|nr:PaaI family thioesterase [Bacteroides sp.]